MDTDTAHRHRTRRDSTHEARPQKEYRHRETKRGQTQGDQKSSDVAHRQHRHNTDTGKARYRHSTHHTQHSTHSTHTTQHIQQTADMNTYTAHRRRTQHTDAALSTQTPHSAHSHTVHCRSKHTKPGYNQRDMPRQTRHTLLYRTTQPLLPG